MELRVIDGKLVQVREAASYEEQRIASVGRYLAKKSGGHMEATANYGQVGAVHRNPDGSRCQINNPRHITDLSS